MSGATCPAQRRTVTFTVPVKTEIVAVDREGQTVTIRVTAGKYAAATYVIAVEDGP